MGARAMANWSVVTILARTRATRIRSRKSRKSWAMWSTSGKRATRRLDGVEKRTSRHDLAISGICVMIYDFCWSFGSLWRQEDRRDNGMMVMVGRRMDTSIYWAYGLFQVLGLERLGIIGIFT
jgi:hypothetical protein